MPETNPKMQNYTTLQFNELPEWARDHILALEQRCNVATKSQSHVGAPNTKCWCGITHSAETVALLQPRHIEALTKEIAEVLENDELGGEPWYVVHAKPIDSTHIRVQTRDGLILKLTLEIL